MKKTLLIAFCVFGFGTAFCQSTKPEIISASGDYFTNANATLSWTIGECITETYSSSGNILTQGFQQSKYLITAVDKVAKNNLKINIFPNPSSDFINVAFDNNLKEQSYTLKLFDMQGKELLTQKINTNQTRLAMKQYATGVYFLKITDTNNQSSNYQIIKSTN